MKSKFRFCYFPQWLPLLLLPALLLPAAVNAEDQFRITPFLGYRTGGSFEDAETGNSVDLDESQSYGLIFGIGEEDTYELSISVQPTTLTGNSGVSSENLFDVDVINVMVAGKNIVSRETGGFVSGMIGFTHFDPQESGLSSDTRFAAGVGGGFDYPLSDRLSFRIEGRGIATFLDSSGGLFCSSSRGCVAYADSSVLFQFEALTGLTFRF
jgi:hypothetical protein